MYYIKVTKNLNQIILHELNERGEKTNQSWGGVKGEQRMVLEGQCPDT